MNDQIDVSDIPRAELLREMYNRATPQGYGYLQAIVGDMSLKEAEDLINGVTHESDYPGAPRMRDSERYFDYLHGRVIKSSFNGKTLDSWGYDRDYGEGAAQEAIDAVRERMASPA